VAHRPSWSNLLAREVLRNRRRDGGRFLAPLVEKASECVGELAATGDTELAVDVAEVRFGGLSGDEQRLRDLTIGEAVGGEPRRRAVRQRSGRRGGR
jgi:hypothetical protein